MELAASLRGQIHTENPSHQSNTGEDRSRNDSNSFRQERPAGLRTSGCESRKRQDSHTVSKNLPQETN